MVMNLVRLRWPPLIAANCARYLQESQMHRYLAKLTMNIYLEFCFSMVWALVVAVALKRLIWRDMAFVMVFLSGLMGGLAGWLLGAMMVDHLDWFMNMSHEYRLVAIGVTVALFVGAIQRNLSKESGLNS